MKTKQTLLTTAVSIACFIPLAHGYLNIETKLINQYHKAKARFTAYLLKEYTSPMDLKNLVTVEAKARGIPPELAFAVVEQESNWNPAAVRQEPALRTMSIGLFQILPPSAKACPGSPTAAELFHPLTNIQCGLDLLAKYLKTNSPRRALVAYNGGEGCLTRTCGSAEAYASSVLERFSSKLM